MRVETRLLTPFNSNATGNGNGRKAVEQSGTELENFPVHSCMERALHFGYPLKPSSAHSVVRLRLRPFPVRLRPFSLLLRPFPPWSRTPCVTPTLGFSELQRHTLILTWA